VAAIAPKVCAPATLGGVPGGRNVLATSVFFMEFDQPIERVLTSSAAVAP